MKAKIHLDLCTGCEMCVEICPDVFEMEDGLASVKVTPIPEGMEEPCREAKEACPVEAIELEA